jgi:hypothetical protein
MLNPQQQQKLAERRAAMSAEERQIAALEQIADNLFNVHGELVAIRSTIQAASRARP